MAFRGRLERLGHRLFVAVATRPWLFRLFGWLARHSMGIAKRLQPPLVREWLASRNLPTPPRESFRSAWKRRPRTSTSPASAGAR